MKFPLFLSLFVFFAIGLLAEGVKENSNNSGIVGEQESFAITDYTGREVLIPRSVKKIVVVDPDSVPIIQAIGAEELVAGIGKMTDSTEKVFPSLGKIPKVGDYTAPDIEKILEINPDIIFLSYWTPKDIDRAIDGAIPIVRLRLEPETYGENIHLIGHILGKENEANDFVEWYMSQLDIIKKKIATVPIDERKRVFEFYGGEYGLTEGPPYGTFGKESPLGNAIITMAGGINIASSQKGDWIVVDPEWVIMENPDYIVRDVFASQSGCDAIGYDAPDNHFAREVLRLIKTGSALEGTEAVINGDVCVIDGGLRQELWFLGVCYIAKQLYPDLLHDFYPEEIHQEFLARFIRTDFDISERGLFIYSE